MKKILVPVDFSGTALNAARYAAQLSTIIETEILLYNVFHLPVDAEGSNIVAIPYTEIKKATLERLTKLKKRIVKQYGVDLKISCEVNMGLFIDQISEVCTKKKIDLIIMGISDAGKIKELLVGSNSLNIIHNINCPVIIVPPKAAFKSVSKIVFACDYNTPQPYTVINQVIEYTKLLKASLDIVYVNKIKHESLPVEKLSERLKLESKLKTINHAYHSLDNEDVVEGLNAFVRRHKSSLVIMLPKKHNILERVMQKSETKKMAFHSHVPLLAIH
jgi:nucleotide-binding universal stress UspA family protein